VSSEKVTKLVLSVTMDLHYKYYKYFEFIGTHDTGKLLNAHRCTNVHTLNQVFNIIYLTCRINRIQLRLSASKSLHKISNEIIGL
jgi:hypothetical protein